MKEIDKKIIKEMKEKDTVARLIASGSWRLKEGKNIIDIIDKDGKLIRKKVVYHTGEDSKVQQSFKDETDIKYILQKYGKSKMAPTMINQALYGDFSEVPSFQEAQNRLIQAQESFMTLSSDVRKKFDNDPTQFLEFVSKKENVEEMRKMGLMKPEEKPKGPVKVEVINQGGLDGGKQNT
jgi:phage internal scaffolding protein